MDDDARSSDQFAAHRSRLERARERAALRASDGAFVLCAAATTVAWSAGITFWLLMAVAAAWSLSWWWWRARRPLTFWGPTIAAVVTVTIVTQHVPDVAFVASKGCLEQVAASERAAGVDDWADIGLRNIWSGERYRTGTEPGRCGLISWTDTYVVEAATANGTSGAVVFAAAGQTRGIGLLDFVQHGLVHIEGGPPSACSEIVRYDGSFSSGGCDIGNLGDDWYWFSYWHESEAT